MAISHSDDRSLMYCGELDGVPFYLEEAEVLTDLNASSSKCALPSEDEVVAITTLILSLERGNSSPASLWGSHARVEVLR